LTGRIPMVSQFGRADHLTDHTGCQGNVVNQSDYGNQRETGWRPNDRQYSRFTQGRPPRFIDHKCPFIKHQHLMAVHHGRISSHILRFVPN
jgi:hypothetical protein